MYFYTSNRACSLLYQYVRDKRVGKYLLPVNVCPVIPLTLSLAGASFEFVDISNETLCMDEQKVMDILAFSGESYKGVFFVRTYGYIYDTSHFFTNIHHFDSTISIIDDRCLCVPELPPTNTYGADFILYSTGYGKQVDLGGGGFCYLSEELHTEGMDVDFYQGVDVAKIYNAAFNESKIITSVPKGWLSLEKLAIDEDTYIHKVNDSVSVCIDHREKINSVYMKSLPSEIIIGDKFNQWRFNILVSTHLKNEIINTLFTNSLFASSHYKSVNRLFNNDEYLISDKIQREVINLFNDYHYTEEMAKTTCEIINIVLERHY